LNFEYQIYQFVALLACGSSLPTALQGSRRGMEQDNLTEMKHIQARSHHSFDRTTPAMIEQDSQLVDSSVASRSWPPHTHRFRSHNHRSSNSSHPSSHPTTRTRTSTHLSIQVQRPRHVFLSTPALELTINRRCSRPQSRIPSCRRSTPSPNNTS
jgi:hypothetical protein